MALLAAGLSYYLAVSLLPMLVLAAGVVGLVSRNNDQFVAEVIEWFGVNGQAADLVSESIDHAERRHAASSVIGVFGLVWASLAVTGALRRAVDAVWDVADVGWTARFRSLPWAVVALVLVVGSVSFSGVATFTGPAAGITAAMVGAVVTLLLSFWFLGRLSEQRPEQRALAIAAVLLAVALEVVKNGAIHVVPRAISRDSALYGAIGSALAVLVLFLVVSWVLLTATAIAAELTDRPCSPIVRRRTEESNARGCD